MHYKNYPHVRHDTDQSLIQQMDRNDEKDLDIMKSMLSKFTDQYVDSLEGITPTKTDIYKLSTNTAEYIQTITRLLGSFVSLEKMGMSQCNLLADKLQVLWVLLVTVRDNTEIDMLLSVVSKFCDLRCFAELSLQDEEVATLLVNLFSSGNAMAIIILGRLLNCVALVEENCIVSIVLCLNRELTQSELMQRFPVSLISLIAVLYQSIGDRQELKEVIASQLLEILDQRNRSEDVPLNRLTILLRLWNQIEIPVHNRKIFEHMLHECSAIMEINREFLMSSSDSYNLYGTMFMKVLTTYDQVVSLSDSLWTEEEKHNDLIRSTICSIMPVEGLIDRIWDDLTTTNIQMLRGLWKINKQFVFDKIIEVTGSLTTFYQYLLNKREYISGQDAVELFSFVADLNAWLGHEAEIEEEEGDFSISEFADHYDIDRTLLESIRDISHELSD